MKTRIASVFLILIISAFFFTEMSPNANDVQNVRIGLQNQINDLRDKSCLPPFGDSRFTGDLFVKKEEYDAGANLRAEEIRNIFANNRPNGGLFNTAYPSEYPLIREFRFELPPMSAREVINEMMNDPELKAGILLENFHKLSVGSYKADNGFVYWVVVAMGRNRIYDIENETIKEEIDYEVIVQENSELPSGIENVIQQGEKGERQVSAKTYTDRTTQNMFYSCAESSSEIITKEPVPHIVEKGTGSDSEVDKEIKVEKETEVVPYNIIEEEDPTLPIGETKVKQIGKNGEKEIVYEVTYENGVEVNRTVISETVTIDPVDEIILIGTKKIEVKIETDVESVPYDTIEEYDPTLPIGETKIKQSGKDGQKEIVYEVSYENGVEVSRVIISETIIMEKVKEIILVGTKKTEIKNDDVYSKESENNGVLITEADKEEAHTLPKTGTQNYTYLVIGILFVLIGLLTYPLSSSIRKRRL